MYMCVITCHSNETLAPIANPPNSAQLESTPHHSPSSHPGPCSSVEYGQGQTDRHTDTQTAVANIHFASTMPHAKCNKSEFDWQPVKLLQRRKKSDVRSSTEAMCNAIVANPLQMSQC